MSVTDRLDASLLPPPTEHRLAGWELVWLRLRPTGSGADALDRLWPEAHQRLRARVGASGLTDQAVVRSVRQLFRAAGCDPTRYRPSSEALARRVLKGDTLPRIHPLVDLNNILSLDLLVPCCVVDAKRVTPPFVLRAGREGESMSSMRGPFELAGKPLLEDRDGPFGTPITDAERVKVEAGAGEAWLVAYMPLGHGGASAAVDAVGRALGQAPVAVLTPWSAGPT